MALGLIARFAAVASQVWSRKLTVGSVVAVGAAREVIPVGLAVADHETNGALSFGALQSTVSGLKKLAESGASPETIEAALNSASYIVDVSKTFEKGAQNFYVAQRMQDKQGVEAVQAGKRAAVEFLMLPDNVATAAAKHYIRKEIADSMFKGNRDAADQHIAKTFIEDLVKDAQVIPLKGHQVTQGDVKNAIQNALQNPDQHPIAAKYLQADTRLLNGMRQLWPDLRAAPAEAAEKKKKEGLSDVFDKAAEGDNVVMKMFLLVMQMLMQAMGLSGGAKPAPEAAAEAKRAAPAAPAPRPQF